MNRATILGVWVIALIMTVSGVSAFSYNIETGSYGTYTNTGTQYTQFPVYSSTHVYQDNRGMWYSTQNQYVYGMTSTSGYKAWSNSPYWTCVGSGCGQTYYTPQMGSRNYHASYGYFYQYQNPMQNYYNP